MTFKNACFISYSGSDARRNKFVETFKEGLEAQLLNTPRAGVFLDRERIKSGDKIPETIAKELCLSACMILIYNPSYFDLEHDYCAREYKAMRALESARVPEDTTKSLIITVVLRGMDYFPKELKGTLIFDFQKEIQNPGSFTKEDLESKLISIAEAVEERYYGLMARMKKNGEPLEETCRKSKLPTKSKIKKWLKGIIDERDEGMDIF